MPAHAPVRANTSADSRLVEGMLLHCPSVEWRPPCGRYALRDAGDTRIHMRITHRCAAAEDAVVVGCIHLRLGGVRAPAAPSWSPARRQGSSGDCEPRRVEGTARASDALTPLCASHTRFDDVVRHARRETTPRIEWWRPHHRLRLRICCARASFSRVKRSRSNSCDAAAPHARTTPHRTRNHTTRVKNKHDDDHEEGRASDGRHSYAPARAQPRADTRRAAIPTSTPDTRHATHTAMGDTRVRARAQPRADTRPARHTRARVRSAARAWLTSFLISSEPVSMLPGMSITSGSKRPSLHGARNAEPSTARTTHERAPAPKSPPSTPPDAPCESAPWSSPQPRAREPRLSQRSTFGRRPSVYLEARAWPHQHEVRSPPEAVTTRGVVCVAAPTISPPPRSRRRRRLWGRVVLPVVVATVARRVPLLRVWAHGRVGRSSPRATAPPASPRRGRRHGAAARLPSPRAGVATDAQA